MPLEIDPRGLSEHDLGILGKISHITGESAVSFGKALEKADVLGIMDLYYDELISHMEDLVDELESPKTKAQILLYIIELKANLKVERARTRATLEFLDGKA